MKAEEFPRARNPSYKIWADFGERFGTLQTSAQITHHYKPKELVGMQIIGCLNLGKKNIAGFISQFLLVGFSDPEGHISLITTSKEVPNDQKLH